MDRLVKITNPKHQITNKFQLTKSKTAGNCVRHLEIGVWDLFGICNLVFGI
jgi:hypothetical protein